MIRRLRVVRGASNERGAMLVVTALVMLTLLVGAASAIDTAIRFVHSRHLQSQADAAARAEAPRAPVRAFGGASRPSFRRAAVGRERFRSKTLHRAPTTSHWRFQALHRASSTQR